jgi:hypothetical protein
MYGQHLVTSVPAMLATYWVQNPHIGEETGAAQWSDTSSDLSSAGDSGARGAAGAGAATGVSTGVGKDTFATEELSMNLAIRLHTLIAGRHDKSTGASAGSAPLGLDVATYAAAMPILSDGSLDNPSLTLRDRYMFVASKVIEALRQVADEPAASSRDWTGVPAGRASSAAGAASAPSFPSLGQELGDITVIDQLLIPAVCGFETCVSYAVAVTLRERILNNDDELNITKLLASVGGQTAKLYAVRTTGLLVNDWLLKRLRIMNVRTPQLLYTTLHSMATVGVDNKADSQPPTGFARCGVVSLAVSYALDVQARFESAAC